MSWIVERMLPVLDGVWLAKAARAVGIKTPVLFLRTLAGIHDRVARLDADYLLKPFSCAEVLAPVNALARRPSLAAALPACCASPISEVQHPQRLSRRPVRRSGPRIPVVEMRS